MDAETDLFQLMLLPAPSSSPIYVLSARSRQIKNLYGAMFAFSEGAGVEKKKTAKPDYMWVQKLQREVTQRES